MNKPWYIYLLYNSETKRTYVGATTDPKRRLRQHRGEIKGGARATKAAQSSWQMMCYLAGFKDRTEAYRWEKIIKGRARGLPRRTLAFITISKGRCPEDPKRPHLFHYPVPEGVEIYFI